MKLLHNIGETDAKYAQSNYNTRDEVLFCDDDLSFDGIYLNVWENRDVIKPALMFVMGNYIGGDNSFDEGMPYEKYCNMAQLEELKEMGHTIGWHTWSHPDLTTISLEKAREEMTCPWPDVKDFAYPYGEFNQDLMDLAKELGYERAWSVTQGNDDPYSLRREYL